MRTITVAICISGLIVLAAACGRVSEAEAPAAPAPVATPTLAAVPDAEADSIPMVNGLPTVPLTAWVNFLDALDSRPIYRMPAEYNINHTAVQIIKEEEALQLKAYEPGGYWQIGSKARRTRSPRRKPKLS